MLSTAHSNSSIATHSSANPAASQASTTNQGTIVNTALSNIEPQNDAPARTLLRAQTSTKNHISFRAATTAMIGLSRLKPIPQDAKIIAAAFNVNALQLDQVSRLEDSSLDTTRLDKQFDFINSMQKKVIALIHSADSKKSKYLHEMLPTFVSFFAKNAGGNADLLENIIPMIQNDHFSAALSQSQHKVVAQTIGNQLVAHGTDDAEQSSANRETLLNLTLGLLQKPDNVSLKPYIEIFLNHLLSSLPDSIEREVTLSQLLDEPSFLSHLNSSQHHQLMSLFNKKIKAPFAAGDLNSPQNVEIHKQRAIYLHLANKLINTQLDKQQGGIHISAANRARWFSTLNTAIGGLYHQSLYVKKDFAELTVLINHSLNSIPINAEEQKVLNKLNEPGAAPSTLHSTLMSFKSTLENYKNNNLSNWYNLGQETRSINKMIFRLSKYEQLATVVNTPRAQIAQLEERVRQLEAQVPQQDQPQAQMIEQETAQQRSEGSGSSDTSESSQDTQKAQTSEFLIFNDNQYPQANHPLPKEISWAQEFSNSLGHKLSDVEKEELAKEAEQLLNPQQPIASAELQDEQLVASAKTQQTTNSTRRMEV